MSNHAIIMEGDFNEYTLSELLEVASLCRQLIRVSLSYHNAIQGHLLLKAGQLLDVKLETSPLNGSQGFYELLRGTFDQFRVLQIRGQAWSQAPLGSLADLMKAPPPKENQDQVVIRSTPSSLTPHQLSSAGMNASSTSSTPSTSSIPEQQSSLPKPPALKTPIPARSSLSSSSIPTSPLNASRSLLPRSGATPTSLASALPSRPNAQAIQQSSENLDVAETSLFSEEQMRELLMVIEAIEKQRKTLTSIETECQRFDQHFQQMHNQLIHQKTLLEHLQSKGEAGLSTSSGPVTLSHESSSLLLQEVSQRLNEAQQAQQGSIQQLFAYAQQSQTLLLPLQRDLHGLQGGLLTSHGASPQAPASTGSDVFGAQLLLEIAQNKEDKRWSHITPMMIVSLFIQVLSLLLLGIVAMKTLF